MHLRRAAAGLGAVVLTATAHPGAQPKRPIAIDDLMKLRSIVAVQIAPDGQAVAYVVSTPNLQKNEHDAALYVEAVAGGAPPSLSATVRIFNTARPRPQVRWAPDAA